MSGGYFGRIAVVDIAEGKVTNLPFDESLQKLMIGGCGIGAWLLDKYLDYSSDPFAPGNPLIFAVGPLTGTGVFTSSRYEVVGRSPLTGFFGQADSGGGWGEELKKCGIDALVIIGQASSPVYVWIDNGSIEIRKADHLWGQDCYQIEESIRLETDDRAAVLSIGPAGENGCLLAAVMNDGRAGRAAARTGLGAIMGSKRLKAVAAKGRQRPIVAHPEKLKPYLKEITTRTLEQRIGLNAMGTLGGMLNHEKFGAIPIKNWQIGSCPEEIKSLSGPALKEGYLTSTYNCRGCLIGCGREVMARFDPGESNHPNGGPEYESTAFLGPDCLVFDFDYVIQANELCNRYGLDTISTGSVVAFGMEAYEKGLITKKDTQGIELKWGNGEALLAVIKAIAFSEGIGRLLGKGVRIASLELGGEAYKFAVHVKGLEYPGHDGRAYNSAALAYATNARGACHNEAMSHVVDRGMLMPELGITDPVDRFSLDGKGVLVARMQDMMCMYDSLKLCKITWFTGNTIKDMVNVLNYVTGWDMDKEEFLKTGERIFNLKRIINIKLGATRADDTIPYRIAYEKRGSGTAAENLPLLDPMLNDYYTYRGWNQDVIPTREKLSDLNLSSYYKEVSKNRQ